MEPEMIFMITNQILASENKLTSLDAPPQGHLQW